ncbi:MAG TPA: alpha/beta hydrolase-fold protein [Gaiellaceae bacterium]|nr:alpha/beta hydrolase-fold protein [Gaiellaceae bacterium]
MIEIRFQIPDPRRRLAAVRLAHELRERLPHEFTRRGRGWELTAPSPDVARFEYQFELIDADGGSEWVVDPANPKTASGPWGPKSVWEEPGYAPPAWVREGRVGEAESVTIPSRVLKAELPALIWAHPDATAQSPMLVALDGPEYAEHSSLLTLLGQLPPLRATLLGPVDRNETFSASARYARALADEILPALPPAPVRVGLGASLGALALFHAHRRHQGSFDALLLQSGSFFRRADLHERAFPRYDRIARFMGNAHRTRPERAIPIVLGCGTVEENLPANRALEASLRRQGYDARLHEFRDGHNWIAWRDSLHPHLLTLLQRP